MNCGNHCRERIKAPYKGDLFFMNVEGFTAKDTGAIDRDTLSELKRIINNYKSQEPVFVFSHQPIYGTVNNSTRSDSGALTNSTKVKNIIKSHKNVITFTSHTHNLMAANSNSIAYTGSGKSGAVFDTGSISANAYPQWYHARVYSDGVTVQGVKYINGNIETIFSETVTY